MAAQPLKALPDGYKVKRVVDFKKAHWILIMNVIAVPLLLLLGAFFLFVVLSIRPEDLADLVEAAANPARILSALLLSVFAIVLHELIHGVGFWWFTRTRPVFGLNLWAAYAGAPGWYLPRSQHFIIGLSPFVVITALGLILLLLIPTSLVLAIFCVLVFNAVGAIGDLVACFFEICAPRDALVQDTGMIITIYTR